MQKYEMVKLNNYKTEFYNHNTNKFESLGGLEYLLTQHYYDGWTVLASLEVPRPWDFSFHIIGPIGDENGDPMVFKTLKEAKKWIKSVNRKHVRHYNKSY